MCVCVWVSLGRFRFEVNLTTVGLFFVIVDPRAAVYMRVRETVFVAPPPTRRRSAGLVHGLHLPSTR